MLPTSRDDFATKKSRNQRKTVANIGYLSELDKYLLGKILILTLGEEHITKEQMSNRGLDNIFDLF